MKPIAEIQNNRKKKNHLVSLLQETYITRREKNSSYSLSSFARDLGISKSLLSRVLSGERAVSMKLAIHLTVILGLDDNQRKRAILNSIDSRSTKSLAPKKLKEKLEEELESDLLPFYTNVDVEKFKAMSSWYHLAILNLVTIKGFKNSPLWIAKRLGISTTEARDAIERLLGLGLLIEKGETLVRGQSNLHIKTTRSELAVKSFHEQMIKKSLEELKKVESSHFERRLINGITFTCEEKHIAIIKKKIDQFQDEILALTGGKNTSELYQMNFQFFPLIQKEKAPKGDE